jgi:hypothetical protein
MLLSIFLIENIFYLINFRKLHILNSNTNIYKGNTKVSTSASHFSSLH